MDKTLPVVQSVARPRIDIFRWKDVPPQVKQLSTHGGDEDWVVYIPKELKDEAHMFNDSYSSSFGHPQVIDLGQLTIIIYAHA